MAKVFTLNDAIFIHLDFSSVHITMTERCYAICVEFDIDVTFERLARLVDIIDVKYTRFSNIASENAIHIFNRHQLVDCAISFSF